MNNNTKQSDCYPKFTYSFGNLLRFKMIYEKAYARHLLNRCSDAKESGKIIRKP